MRKLKKMLVLVMALLVFCVSVPADWYMNPFTGKLDYFEAGGAGANNLVGIDAAATAGFLGAAFNNGVFRVDQNELTYTDGGDFITLGLADHNTARTALGLAIGTDVLAYDVGLSNLASVAMAADRFYYTTADNVHVAGTITAFGRSIIADINEAAFKATVNLEIGTDVLAWQTTGIADNNLVEIDDAGVANGEYARFTANGLEGRTNADVLSDIGAAIAAHAMSTHSDIATYNINTSGLATVTKGYILGAEATASPGGAFTIDWTAKQNHRVTITGVNLDITFTNPSGPCRLILVVIQGDGDDTVDWTNEADLKWPGGVSPALSTGAADVDIVSFYFDGTNYYGVANYDFQ